MKKNIFITLLLLLTLGFVEARHIIGGEFTYECLGSVDGQRRYRFVLKVYRDCASGGAEFDNPAAIGVYRCGVNESCGDFNQRNVFIERSVNTSQIVSVSPPDLPCLELPPNICVQEGTYTFELNLPVIDESYHIIYQRCCRNESITNIRRPGDAGATYSIEINPLAQQVCNNSPSFNSFPPTVICIGEPLEFDHSATDADGDQLVYSFCAPNLGGGTRGLPNTGGDPNECLGVEPNPPCPPPYGTVQFIQPAYTFLRPLGGNPEVTINTNNGLITGIPDRIGQFVVGVCVEEYRNGQLLSTLRRDFQFNVASCTPIVEARIRSDSLVGRRSFLVNSCGNNTITFDNQSFQRDAISEYEWVFDIQEEEVTSSEWNATITFPDIGQYQGQLILNPNTNCSDTANIFVDIFPEIKADFEFEYDTCIAGPVAFTDLSVSNAGQNAIRSWNWNFGDGNSSRIRSPNHLYRIPGDLPVTLRVRDINRCEASATKNVNYFPIPNLIIISPSEFLGCAPAEIFFDNLSFPIDDTYDINWDFGDGGMSSAISPTHTFNEIGTYTVSVDVTSPIGCTTDTVFQDLITVLPSPVASFDFNPKELSNLEPVANFIDQSTDAVRWRWEFDDVGNSSLRNPTFTFPDTGRYEVMLEVTHQSGCIDSTTQLLDVIPLVRYFLPNAFTPNNDGRNEEYLGKGMLLGVTNFNFSIWNRWGEKLFETNNPDEGWNGRKNNTGQDAPNGVYVCVVSFTGPRGQRYNFEAFATLVR